MGEEQEKTDKKIKPRNIYLEGEFLLLFFVFIIFSWPYLSGFIFDLILSSYFFYYFSWMLLILIIFLINGRQVKEEDKKQRDD